MRIKSKFIRLTSRTYPHGTERLLTSYLPKNYQKDGEGNYYYQIGDSNTMFTCHLDTACKYVREIKHVREGKYIKTDGNTILGADDKAGMTVMLYMISKGVPGLYYFFVGEEVGCIGSGKAASSFKFNNIKKVISFDRRGTNSVITHQLYGRCCSDEFAIELSNRLNSTGYKFNYEPDYNGILTDSAMFVDIAHECTNISVGYYDEHKLTERQDIQHLVNLCKACTEISWEDLPIKRNPGESDWDCFDMESIYDRGISPSIDISSGRMPSAFKGITSTSEFSEELYTYIKTKEGNKKAYISQTWINYEYTLIQIAGL